MLAGGGLVDYCLSFAYVRSLHSPPRPVPARNVRRTTTDREVRGYQARGQSGSGSRQKACEFVIVRRHCFRACILCAVGALPETKNPPSGGSPEAGFKKFLLKLLFLGPMLQRHVCTGCLSAARTTRFVEHRQHQVLMLIGMPEIRQGTLFRFLVSLFQRFPNRETNPQMV